MISMSISIFMYIYIHICIYIYIYIYIHPMTPETARDGIVIMSHLYEGKVVHCEVFRTCEFTDLWVFKGNSTALFFFEVFRAGEMLIFLFSVLEKYIGCNRIPWVFFHACQLKLVLFQLLM